MEVITAVKAVKAAAASRGVKGVELGQLMACLASIPAEEYRAFILPIADDPEAVFAYVQLRYKAQGRLSVCVATVKLSGFCWPWC